MVAVPPHNQTGIHRGRKKVPHAVVTLDRFSLAVSFPGFLLVHRLVCPPTKYLNCLPPKPQVVLRVSLGFNLPHTCFLIQLSLKGELQGSLLSTLGKKNPINNEFRVGHGGKDALLHCCLILLPRQVPGEGAGLCSNWLTLPGGAPLLHVQLG